MVGVFHDDIQCFVVGISYVYRDGLGILTIGENSATNMSGAIRLFEKIDPAVKQIFVNNGDGIDIIYARGDDGWFVVADPRQ